MLVNQPSVKSLQKSSNLNLLILIKLLKKRKKKIKEIFENKGENYFRKIEKKITLKELKKDNLVIALGGGAIFKLISEKRN